MRTVAPIARSGPTWAVAWAIALAGCAQDQGPVHLVYAAPTSCVAAYRVQVDERFDLEGYPKFYNRSEEHSVSWLGIAAADDGSAKVRLLSDDAGVKAMREPEISAQDITRAWEGNGQAQGPAAPDAACRDRSWDPLEDAMALAFPRLPPHSVRPGDTWMGADVRGDGGTCSARDACCNLGACMDAQQQRDRSLACVVGPWRESLANHLGGQVWSIHGLWSDGRAGGEGASARREVEFDRERGRVLRATITHTHPFLGLTRQISVEAIDACGDLAPPRQEPSGLTRLQRAFEYKQPAGKSPQG